VRRPASGPRLFAAYAVASLVPVLALGLLLNATLRSEMDERAMNEAVSRAETIADAAIEPVFAGDDLIEGLSPAQRAELARLTGSLHGDASVIRLRVRTVDGTIVFDADRPDAPPVVDVDDEAVEAAEGDAVQLLTRVGADEVDGAASDGVAAVETYVALHGPGNRDVIGVLETYLPYEPFRAAAMSSQR
jgi:hypothetical protein